MLRYSGAVAACFEHSNFVTVNVLATKYQPGPTKDKAGRPGKEIGRQNQNGRRKRAPKDREC